MELKIKMNADNEIVVYFSPKDKIIISEKKEDFKLENINQFLISIATNLPDNEEITIINESKDEKSETYKHVVFLFSEFAKNFNLNKNNK